jgi:phosphoglycolate phosphatase
MFQAIIFDYNGVLINDLEFHEEAYLMAAKEMGFPLTREVARKYISATAIQKRKLYFGDISDDAWNRLFLLKTEYYFDLIEHRSPLFPEVKEVLSFLGRRYLLGLLSNTPRGYFEKVFPQDLARLFQATTFGDEMRDPKPDPGPLLGMMRRLNVSPDQCCYVGDSISDVLMAKRAGIRIFSVTTGDSSEEELIKAGSDRILNRLSDLIRELNSAECLQI